MLPTTSLGCLSFEGEFEFLDWYFKEKCCMKDENGDTVPIFIDVNDNGYDDRYKPSESLMVRLSGFVWIIGAICAFMRI